ncbi:hypothetical protein ACHAWX_000424 [Stephanocyclus meneghinianus]
MFAMQSIAIIVALNAIQAFAFSTHPSSALNRPTHSRRGPLFANNEDHETPNNHVPFSSRRHAALQISAAAAAVLAGSYPSGAIAQDADTGKLIEFTVNNLDGNEGSTGTFVVKTHPEWAPSGVERFEALAESSFFDGCRVFRVLPGFVSQFGINGNPEVQAKWRSQNLRDDPVRVTNKRGTVVFATAGPNTRTTQLFINLSDRNSFLDKQGFSPLGEVVSGMDVVERFYSGYGEGAPAGKGPNQGLIQAKGNEYLESAYPKLSYFSKVSIK